MQQTTSFCIIACLLALLIVVSSALVMNSIDLTGPWKFAPDMNDSGLAIVPEQWNSGPFASLAELDIETNEGTEK